MPLASVARSADPQWRLLAIAVTGLLCLVGCGGDEPNARPSAAPQTEKSARSPSAPATGPEQRPGAAAANRTMPEGSRPSPRGPGSKVMRTPSGGLVITPPTPTQARARPSSKCGEAIRAPSGRLLFAPGAPGLIASKTDRSTVLVTVTVGGGQRRCEPTHARVTLDDNDDGAPGWSRVYRLQGRRLQRSLKRSTYGGIDPDVASSSLLTRRGRSSRAVTILIGR